MFQFAYIIIFFGILGRGIFPDFKYQINISDIFADYLIYKYFPRGIFPGGFLSRGIFPGGFLSPRIFHSGDYFQIQLNLKTMST